jgi:hypothetical protein
VTQVRAPYLRMITVYLWNCKIPACDHEQEEFRLLAYTSLCELRASLLQKLQSLPIERVYKLCNHAWLWINAQNNEQLNSWFADFDVEQKLAISRPRPSADLSLIDALT